MRAMVLTDVGRPLQLQEWPTPEPAPGEVLLRVQACGVCRTDLHVADGDLPALRRPVIPGHEIVGRVVGLGPGVSRFQPGDRVGVSWLGWACGECDFCCSRRENLCPRARFTGYTRHGGYADHVTADARFCFHLPSPQADVAVAPWLCAGLIGYRALMKVEEAQRLGFYGFGVAAHLLTQVARFQGRTVFAFTRAGDVARQDFARSLGAVWAGDADWLPPATLDAAILFAPRGDLVPRALRAVGPGGTVVCAGIHMSDIPSFPYPLLWQERSLASVANLTRQDGEEFLALAPRVPVEARTQVFPLEQANEALECLRTGSLQGAAVLVPGEA